MQFGESLGAQVALDVAAVGTRRFDELGLDGRPVPGHAVPDQAVGPRGSPTRPTVDPAGMLAPVVAGRRDPRPRRRACATCRSSTTTTRSTSSPTTRSCARPGGWAPRDPAAGGPAGDRVPPGHHLRHHARRPQERDEQQARARSSAGATTTGSSCATRSGTPSACPPPPSRSRAIEAALREREREWATRRMVARRFASARASVLGQLPKWGVDPTSITSTTRPRRSSCAGTSPASFRSWDPADRRLTAAAQVDADVRFDSPSRNARALRRLPVRCPAGGRCRAAPLPAAWCDPDHGRGNAPWRCTRSLEDDDLVSRGPTDRGARWRRHQPPCRR